MKNLLLFLILLFASFASLAQCTNVPTISMTNSSLSNGRLYFGYSNNCFVRGATDSVQYTDASGLWKTIPVLSSFNAYAPAPNGVKVSFKITYYCCNSPKSSAIQTYKDTSITKPIAPSSVLAKVADGGWFIRDTATFISTCSCNTFVHRTYLVTNKTNILITSDTIPTSYEDHSLCILQRAAKTNGQNNTGNINYLFSVQSGNGSSFTTETFSPSFLLPNKQCIDGK